MDNGELKVSWVPTDQNIADFFTKKLSKDKFTLFRDILMGNEALQHHFILPRAARIFAKKLRKSEVFLEVYPKLSYKGFMARTMQNIGMAKLPSRIESAGQRKRKILRTWIYSSKRDSGISCSDGAPTGCSRNRGKPRKPRS